MPVSGAIKQTFTEQDTADKLILPYLTSQYGFPSPESLDYQAQHTLPTDEEHLGRYDGLYLNGGYPYIVLEAKKYAHDLTEDDFKQARSYATSDFFDEPVPFIILSNGREHQFYKKTSELDLEDRKISYQRIAEAYWHSTIEEDPGKVRILLTAEQLESKLKDIKERVYKDMRALFFDFETDRYNLDKYPLYKKYLEKIIDERRMYVGITGDQQKQIDIAVQTISLHFTIKILFIKIIEDLSSGTDVPRIIHNLFPREEYNLMGGIFGHKVLATLENRDRRKYFRLLLKSKKFYKQLGNDLTKVSYQDIFRFGFNIHMVQYGKILSAKNYDRFFPSEQTLQLIKNELIKIDIRNAIIYATPESRNNVIGDIYSKLIDHELRNSIGAVYTPDDTVDFMVELGQSYLAKYRGHKILENACGSGHFYRKIYRIYVDEAISDYISGGVAPNYKQAHSEALEHILGRDIDPFAIQLTILGVFLEQLKDNVKPETLKDPEHSKLWKANFSIDCQDSLHPITVNPDRYLDVLPTLELENPKSLLNSCTKALNPDLIIGNPPYGVKVVETVHYPEIYDLQSKDSYGYFIVNAIKRLNEGKRVIFITSSSFLTIKSHFKLRDFILDNCKIIRITKLHRSTFPGIDIFPVILELEKCSDVESRKSNFYHFYDLWQLHPSRDKDELKSVYDFIINDLSATNPWPYDKKRINRYKIRQGVIHNYSKKTIFDGLPSLFKFAEDIEGQMDTNITLCNNRTGNNDEFRVKSIGGVNIIKLVLRLGNNLT